MIPLTEAFESAVDREKSVLVFFFFLSLSNTISSVLFSLKSNLNCFKVAKNLIAQLCHSRIYDVGKIFVLESFGNTYILVHKQAFKYLLSKDD